MSRRRFFARAAQTSGLIVFGILGLDVVQDGANQALDGGASEDQRRRAVAAYAACC